MHNSLHGNIGTVLKDQRNALRKKLIRKFSDSLNVSINWTYHATERLTERFGGQPTQQIANALMLVLPTGKPRS